MGLPSIFGFERLKIEKVEEGGGAQPAVPAIGSSDSVFEAMFNPSTLSIQYRNRFHIPRTLTTGNTASDSSNPGMGAEFVGREISHINVKLLLDGTRVSDFGLETGLGLFAENVDEKVQAFLKLCMIPDRDSHSAHVLRINWGKVIKDFLCYLRRVNVTYSLFDRDAAPLRAELDCSFISKAAGEESLIELSSPDLTHSRIVKAGDTLPRLCQEIYGDAAYYLKVAAVNELDDFRFLEVGSQIFFPPIAKS